MKRFGILQRLLDDDGITEIMVNGPEHIFIEREGRIVESGLHFSGGQELEDVVQRIAANSDRMVNASSPILDTRLADGSRVNIVLNPISLDGTTVTIRKFYETPLTMERLIQINSITREAADFLQRAIRARYNIFISGGTGSGKTTFLNALSNYIPMDERIITIEDSAELQIRNVGGRQRNLVRLETRNANLEGENQVSIRDLIKSSLRMRPDRIIVGEIRGGEAIDMLQAMNTGMEGSMSTGHANSARDMLSRMETMVLMGMEIPVAAIRSQIGSAVDILVHLGRLRDKTRRVLEIVEILGCVDGEIRTATLYEFQETDGAGKAADGQVFGTLVKRGELANRAKLRMYGMEG
jgi:pilus assembly protein CpaF